MCTYYTYVRHVCVDRLWNVTRVHTSDASPAAATPISPAAATPISARTTLGHNIRRTTELRVLYAHAHDAAGRAKHFFYLFLP